MSEAIFGFIGVLVGSLIPWVREWLNENRLREKHAAYLAVQIVCVLDEYIGKCCEVAGDDGTNMGQPAGRTKDGEAYYDPQVLPPKPPCYPEDVDWKSIDNNLMYRLLALPNNARKTDLYIDASSEHAFPPDYEEVFESRWEGYANLGLEAIKLKEELRKKHGLPEEKIELNPNWNAKQHLEAQRDKVKEIQTQRAAAFQDMTKKIGTK